MAWICMANTASRRAMTKGMKPGWRNRLRREGSGCKMTSSEDCVSADDTSGGGFRQAAVQVTVLSHHRSEEHTSELQSRENLVCRLLLEKKKLIQLLLQQASDTK